MSIFCEAPSCTKLVSFKLLQSNPRFCSDHIPELKISPKSNVKLLSGYFLKRPYVACRYQCISCKNPAKYALSTYQFPVFCSIHKNEDSIYVREHIQRIQFRKEKGKKTTEFCRFENCVKYATMGKDRESKRQFCRKHAPSDYVDLAHKCCSFEGCKKRGLFGKDSESKRQFCKKHVPPGCIDSVHGRCSFEGCKKRGLKKIFGNGLVKYCTKHRPKSIGLEMCFGVNCLEDGIWLAKDMKWYCSNHKPNNSIRHDKKRKIKDEEGENKRVKLEPIQVRLGEVTVDDN